jgi:hypothetical protein
MFKIISLSVLLFVLLASPLLVMESGESSICSPGSYLASLDERDGHVFAHLSLASRWKLRANCTVADKEDGLWTVFFLKHCFNYSNFL